MTNENEEQPDDDEQGIYLRGGYLGREEGRKWDPEPGRTVNIRPKIGLQIAGEEYAIDCRDERQMIELTRGLVKGQVVEFRVEVLPPFRKGEPLKWFLPGARELQQRDRWK